MTADVREVLQKKLKIIDDAANEIRKALEANPTDAFLTAALLMIHKKELQLLSMVTSQGQDTI